MDAVFFGVLTLGIAIGLLIGEAIRIRPRIYPDTRCPACGRGR